MGKRTRNLLYHKREKKIRGKISAFYTKKFDRLRRRKRERDGALSQKLKFLRNSASLADAKTDQAVEKGNQLAFLTERAPSKTVSAAIESRSGAGEEEGRGGGKIHWGRTYDKVIDFC